MADSRKMQRKVPTAPLKVQSESSEPDAMGKLIHERSRLAIVSALAVNASLSFNELKKLLNTTDGNLSVHARKLEDAKYVKCKKTFEKRTPKTVYKLTNVGRKALEAYIGQMEALIRDLRAS